MTDTIHFKTLLETERESLEKELLTIGRRNPSNPNDWEPLPKETEQNADILDVAENIEGYEDNTAILKDLEIRYNEILAALARIADGSYGSCVVDGEAIDEARLEANPSATTCAAHAA